ncbi:SRPBCC family protein [Microbacterium sp. BDGP8]|uniref:SRPBCC family protein n=1 Tax=Microbacterium sp. BDGP8 TaxID=3035531 RepID=UPI00249EBCC6|nr:SRPBCC family protein [Microbacterium sp. BDGP8]WHE35059.1 SRPBCC family protein [Microbacterium sp. BDGP8]
MSKLTVATATMYDLSLAGAEEASRLGEQSGDIDHLLLALTINEQVAGQVLRALGVDLERTRAAVEQQHADQLASLGVQAAAPGPGRITFHERGDFDWNDRALEVLRRAAKGGKRGDAAAVLRELLAEGSGLIEAILERLDTTAHHVRELLDQAEQYPSPPSGAVDGRSLSGAGAAHVAAPVAHVWALVSDPTRMPEWDLAFGRVSDVPDEVEARSVWTAHALETAPNGKPQRVRPDRQRARVELVGFEPMTMIEWTTTWPDSATSNRRRTRIELEPAAGGTHLRISQAWERTGSRRGIPLLRWLMRPLYTFAIWLQISQLGASIGRAFR